MTHDTTKDPRIIVAHLACDLLKKCVKQKPSGLVKLSRDKLVELTSACESALMTLMYMYQEPAALAASEPVKNLSEAAAALAGAYEKLISGKDDRSLLRANIRWCLRILGGLRQRFGSPGTALTCGIDLCVVQVRSVVKEGAFRNTRVTDGAADYAVVTNLTDVETNTRLAAAFLPPREIGGTVSEAMFLGSGRREEAPGTVLSEDQVETKEAAGILYEETAKHRK